ncbi:hypothetical protein CD790_05025 [Streptomyces sp. SAJ15]|nr:hypothetical protein CD790_05025 [Streptomyces sp. SAJ15]
MGRHRRSAPETEAAPERVTTPTRATTPAAPAPTPVAPSDPAAGRHRSGRRGRLTPVRTGLLGVSAAVALGAVAMASGVLPGGDHTLAGGTDDHGTVRAHQPPAGVPVNAGAPSSATEDREEPAASRAADRSASPSATSSPSPSTSASPRSPRPAPSSSTPPSAPAEREPDRADDEGPRPSRGAPAPHKPKAPHPTSAPDSPSHSRHSAVEREVLALVNQERVEAGCSPVTADPELADLAGDFSRDMDQRDFFDHTDPDGATPWDRAKKRGIDDLGGENIARGQKDAPAVMDTWMGNTGHRANILNCEYRTLGVGAHFAEGGPWWTQEFGF